MRRFSVLISDFVEFYDLYSGVMVKSIFAKSTDAKRFLCFLVIKNFPAERKSPWDNHKSLRSFSSISTSCSCSHSSNTSSAAQTFVVIPWDVAQGLFLSAELFFIIKKHKNRLASVIFAKMVLTTTPMKRAPADGKALSYYAAQHG